MKLLRWIRSFLFRRQVDAEMREEMRLHLELRAEQLQRGGVTAEAARVAALREFGNVARHQEIARAERAGVWLELLGRDLRHGVKTAARQPLFSVVAVGTLALGIGLNLAIVSLGNAMLVRPLPGIREADELVTIGRMRNGAGFGNTSFPVYAAYRNGSTEVFRQLAASARSQFSISGDELTERVLGEYVSANYFETLGVRFAAGRTFRPEEDAAVGRDPVAIISDRLWQRRWNRAPEIIGRRVMLNGHAFTIVGVTEPGFRALHLPNAYDVWVPLRMRGTLQAEAGESYGPESPRWLERLIGRLQPGVTPRQAAAHLRGLAQALQPEPEAGQPLAWAHRVVGYSPFPTPDRSGPYIFLGILLALGVLVLGVVGVNAASLLLSRALARRREIAVRLAVGASRGRVIRQVVAEGFVLAAAAAALGVLLAQGAGAWVLSWIPGENNEGANVDLVFDWRLALTAVALTFVTAAVVGLLPAWQSSRVAVLPALKSGEGPESRRSRLRSALVVAQVALCTVLLASAGLMFRSVRTLEASDPTDALPGMLHVRLDPRLHGYTKERRDALLAHLQDRLGGVPVVIETGFAAIAPFADGSMSLGQVYGGKLTESQAISCNVNFIGGNYLRALRVPLLRGREFAAEDRTGAPPVVLVNEALAQRLWPDADPVGQMLFSNDASEPPKRVVGVVANDPILRDRPGTETLPYCYLPIAQRPVDEVTLIVATNAEPASLLVEVRAAMRAFDPHLPIFQPLTLATLRDRTLWQQRIVSGMVACCSGMAVLLAMVGLYAALAQDVIRRTREIGIRLAVGASSGGVLRLVIAGGMKLVALGVVGGLGLAFGVTRGLRSVLVGVSATDPLVFAMAAALVFGLAVLACWLPARRAARVDPAVTLRGE